MSDEDQDDHRATRPHEPPGSLSPFGSRDRSPTTVIVVGTSSDDDRGEVDSHSGEAAAAAPVAGGWGGGTAAAAAPGVGGWAASGSAAAAPASGGWGVTGATGAAKSGATSADDGPSSESGSCDLSRLTCTLCQSLFCFPVQAECGCAFCMPCLRELANKPQAPPPHMCPVCRRRVGDCCNRQVDTSLEGAVREAIGDRQYEKRCETRRQQVEHEFKKVYRRNPGSWVPPREIGASGGGQASGNDRGEDALIDREDVEEQIRILVGIRQRNRADQAVSGALRAEFEEQRRKMSTGGSSAENIRGDEQAAKELQSKFEAQASKREHEEKEGLEFAQKMMESGAITERDEEEQGKRVREDEALAQKLQAEEDASGEDAGYELNPEQAAKRKREEEDSAKLVRTLTSSSFDRRAEGRLGRAAERQQDEPAWGAGGAVGGTVASDDTDGSSDDDHSAAVAAAAAPRRKKPRHGATRGHPQTTTGAPDAREEVEGRHIRIRNVTADHIADRSGGWAVGVVTGWITGPCLCDDHAVCGKTNREQLWVEWQDLQNDEMILHIQLSSTRCGSQWIWEESWAEYSEGQSTHQEIYNRGEFCTAPISHKFWGRLAYLMRRWGNGRCCIDASLMQNRNDFANGWPTVLRKQMLRLLQEHEVSLEKSRGEHAHADWRNKLKVTDPRLWQGFIEGQFCAFDVHDLMELMIDLATTVTAAVDWGEEGGETKWIEELKRSMDESIEDNVDGYYKIGEEQCCAGCLRMEVQPDGNDIVLSDHPMFADTTFSHRGSSSVSETSNLKMCPQCLANYERDDNWRLGPERHEENCRICGYDDHILTLCDGRTCRGSFCHGCIGAHAEKYGVDEFIGISQHWECFLCREGHAGLAVNPAALRSFGGERPRQMLGPQEIWIRHSSDDDSSGDEGYSETAAVNDREEEDADDEEATIPYSDDETVERAPARRRGRRGTAAAAAAPARARVFARRTEHLKVCDGSHPFILIENVEGMDEGDRVNVMEMLNLDCTSLDSVRTSFATRKRLYYANFDCQSASEWPDLEGSPTLSACLTTTIPAEGIIVQYLDTGVTDQRFIRGHEGFSRGKATPFDKTLCILPDKGEDLLMARLNDRLRLIGLDTTDTVPKISNDEMKQIKGKNMVYYKEHGLDYLALRLLTVSEREDAMGFPRLRGGELWTHRARSEKVARCQLGESFEVRTIMWRLSKILPQLHERCRTRPLRVLSICDGIGGCLAALLRLDGWDHGIVYVAIEKDADCRRVVRHVCDHHSTVVTLKQLPQCSNAQAGQACHTCTERTCGGQGCGNKCYCGDMLALLPGEKCDIEDGGMISYLEHHAGVRSDIEGDMIDLVVSGYPCKGHSSANRKSGGRRGRTGHDSEQSGKTWWALCFILRLLTKFNAPG